MHYWLNRISPEEQEKDIKQFKLSENVGTATKDWIMCYPYGAYNDATLSLLHRYGALLGITTEVRVANLKTDHLLELPRLDTNDFHNRLLMYVVHKKV